MPDRNQLTPEDVDIDVTDVTELPPRIAATLREAEATVLKMILKRVQEFGELSPSDADSSNLETRAFRSWGVRYRPSQWNGGPLSESLRQAYSRATHRLAITGLIDRVTEGRRDRVARLRFTWLGLYTAFELMPDADRDLVFEGLSRTEWGAGLVPSPEVELPFEVGMLPESILSDE